jgi:hypothetical protein
MASNGNENEVLGKVNFCFKALTTADGTVFTDSWSCSLLASKAPGVTW